MAQLFHPSTNTVARVSIFGAVVILAAFAWVLAVILCDRGRGRQGAARAV